MCGGQGPPARGRPTVPPCLPAVGHSLTTGAAGPTETGVLSGDLRDRGCLLSQIAGIGSAVALLGGAVPSVGGAIALFGGLVSLVASRVLCGPISGVQGRRLVVQPRHLVTQFSDLVPQMRGLVAQFGRFIAEGPGFGGAGSRSIAGVGQWISSRVVVAPRENAILPRVPEAWLKATVALMTATWGNPRREPPSRAELAVRIESPPDRGDGDATHSHCWLGWHLRRYLRRV